MHSSRYFTLFPRGPLFCYRKVRVSFGGGTGRWATAWLAKLSALCICFSVTAATAATNAKTNTVLLSALAMGQMDALLTAKPGRAAMDVAATGSMQPLLDENYIVVVEEKPFEDLSFGDIPIFRGRWVQGQPVAHRIVQRLSGGAGWQTKGDHCENTDPDQLTRRNYQGRIVVAAIHKQTGEVKPLSLDAGGVR